MQVGLKNESLVLLSLPGPSPQPNIILLVLAGNRIDGQDKDGNWRGRVWQAGIIVKRAHPDCTGQELPASREASVDPDGGIWGVS